VVKGRSDIYAWPLPLYIPSEVTWYHAEIPRLRTLLSPPRIPFSPFSPSLPLVPFFFASRFHSFYFSLDLPAPVLFNLSLFFPFLPPPCFISSRFFPSHRPVYLHASSHLLLPRHP